MENLTHEALTENITPVGEKKKRGRPRLTPEQVAFNEQKKQAARELRREYMDEKKKINAERRREYMREQSRQTVLKVSQRRAEERVVRFDKKLQTILDSGDMDRYNRVKRRHERYVNYGV